MKIVRNTFRVFPAMAFALILASGPLAGTDIPRTPPGFAAPGRPGPAGPPTFAAGAALNSARLTHDQAVAAAAREFGTMVLSHPSTVQYGAFTDNSYIPDRATGVPFGTHDAWRVTVTGLRLPLPCAHGVSQCPAPDTTLAIVIDDRTGNFVEAHASK